MEKIYWNCAHNDLEDDEEKPDPRWPHYPKKPHPMYDGDRAIQNNVVRVSIDEVSGQQVAIFSQY